MYFEHFVLPLMLNCLILSSAAGECFLMSAPSANSHSWYTTKNESPGQQGFANNTHLYNRMPHHAVPARDVSRCEDVLIVYILCMYMLGSKRSSMLSDT
jgi:hypothetical protein